MNDDYTCALSGLTPLAQAQIPDELVDDDLGDLPIYWTEVRLRRRVPSVRWTEIQAVKQAVVQQEMSAVPEEHRAAALPVIAIQTEAVYAALEARTPAFHVDEVTLYIAPPSRDADATGLAETQLGLFDTLEVDWLGEDSDDDGDGEEVAAG
jgi:hypothetical protein